MEVVPAVQADAAADPSRAEGARSAWRLGWLTPGWCRAILAAVLALGFLFHLRYLMVDCPIDLSGDEAQYWEWSRQLDIGYYSKGPLVAYIIRASTELFGNTMWAVRLPALVLAVCTSVLTYWLTRKLFGSERLALGVVLLNHFVPMFVAGSLLMTIDPPYFFFWGLATALLAVAVLDEKRWAWVGVGVAVGVGALAKYGALIWPIGMFAFLLLDPRSRKWLRSPWPYAAVGIAALFLIPPMVWNARHDWVTFKHVAKQTGAAQQKSFLNGNFFELVGSQVGVVGPALAVILSGAIIFAFGRRARRDVAVQPGTSADPKPVTPTLDYEVPRKRPGWVARSLQAIRDLAADGATDPNRRQVSLLLWTGLPVFALCVLGSIRSKMQVNWPAAAYFSWMILAGYFLATRMASIQTWRRWRWWVYATVLYGLLLTPVAHDSEVLYPAMAAVNRQLVEPIEARDFDFAAKLKGWEELGQRVARELAAPGMKDPIILCEDYMMTAQMAFYVPGHPKTFCIGPYVEKVVDRKRRSQYDVWPDRSLEQPHLRGRDAIYIGHESEDLPKVFAKVERLPDEEVWRRGMKTRRFRLFKCTDFRGMTLKDPAGAY